MRHSDARPPQDNARGGAAGIRSGAGAPAGSDGDQLGGLCPIGHLLDDNILSSTKVEAERGLSRVQFHSRLGLCKRADLPWLSAPLPYACKWGLAAGSLIQ
jgi:hypothetical protein